MKSILENRSALAKEVDKVEEVAGYLWQKGWAERNGGNITINICLLYTSSCHRELCRRKEHQFRPEVTGR